MADGHGWLCPVDTEHVSFRHGPDCEGCVAMYEQHADSIVEAFETKGTK